jgi:hypothetical protein
VFSGSFHRRISCCAKLESNRRDECSIDERCELALTAAVCTRRRRTLIKSYRTPNSRITNHRITHNSLHKVTRNNPIVANPSQNKYTSHSVAAMDQAKELLEMPREFLKDGQGFITRCSKRESFLLPLRPRNERNIRREQTEEEGRGERQTGT